MYCPNCSSHITKVVLRRVKRERRIVIETGDRGAPKVQKKKLVIVVTKHRI
ncbi:hypothetical protein RND71_031872 [Anisodus tanguticus]|uniref:Uncharacterized protein n=1 Tax=Anisodus tanguticus TaxID=243964 RepID=A0AAE1UZA9_9SOLA|nr:hypothetical protein RND71_031872 [Anisodus tanguticus]